VLPFPAAFASRRLRTALRGVAAAPGLAVVLLAAGCSSATPDEQGGGDRFDAAAPSTSIGDDGGDACGATGFDAAEGTGWSDLYRDFFGPTATASCAGTVGQCHGEASGLGAQASAFVCAGGVSGCYQGMTLPAAGLVSDQSNPTGSTLYGTLRKTCGGGIMPKVPATYFFSPADMERISDWISAGAPNN
jgi:hypothetical protein